MAVSWPSVLRIVFTICMGLWALLAFPSFLAFFSPWNWTDETREGAHVFASFWVVMILNLSVFHALAQFGLLSPRFLPGLALAAASNYLAWPLTVLIKYDSLARHGHFQSHYLYVNVALIAFYLLVSFLTFKKAFRLASDDDKKLKTL
jgi:hypothetical protein